MRVLLINPGTKQSLAKENLAPAYLSAVLKKAGHDVRISDEVAGQRADTVMKSFRPDVVGISCMTMTAPRAYDLADSIRQDGIPVILGGAHPTALPEEALEHADCIIRGEGEIALPSILDSGKIEGCIEGDIIHDLDMLPLPDRKALDLNFYSKSGEQFAGKSYRALGIITSRGCPYHCIFCANSKREAPLRFHSVERVLEEITYLVQEYAIESITFYDELMAANSTRFRKICEGMIAHKFDFLCWECQMHARSVSMDLLRDMKRAGCIQVALGFESGSQRVLDRLQKRTTLEQNYEAVKMVHESGMRVRGCFVIGTPGETLDDIQQTEAFIQDAKIDFVSIHFLTPMPGTLLYDEFADEIRKAGIPWDRFTAGDPSTFQCNKAIPGKEQAKLFLRLSAQYAFRNYSLTEMFRRAVREPRRALHVLLRVLSKQ